MADAQAFISAMKSEMNGYASMLHHPSGSGQAGNIKTMDSRFTFESSEVGADKIYDHAERAFNAWGQYSAFSTRGHGGGGNHYELHFGNHSTHAFVDLIAHEEDGKTIVDCLIRVVE
jgi:hypothetical protein